VSELQHIAAPISRKDIRKWAELIRRLSGDDAAWFDIVRFVELRLPALDEAVSFLIDENLPRDTHACTDVREKCILVRPEIYERAVGGHGRDRMTIAHELGHFLLHSEIRLGRRIADGPIEAFRDPEWQAKCFAGELLISRRHCPKNRHPEEVAALFGVSVDSVLTQFRAWGQESRR
jgi:hypothetical protein